jgi:uncharacterized protein YbaR (Trm112 family)
MNIMACPNCKMSLGWAQVEYKDAGVPWYKPTEQVVRCKYCGVRFNAEPKKKHLNLVILSLMLASLVYLEQGFVGWGKWAIGILLCVIVFLGILETNRPYERIE